MLQLLAPYALVFVLNLFAGAIATFGIGVAIDHTHLNLLGVFIAIIAADTIGDTAYYLLGRFALHSFGAKLLRRKKIAARYKLVEQYYAKHGASTVFLGKMSDILAIPAVMLAGASKMSYKLYMLICTATSMLKTILILAAGYFLSRSTNTADAHFIVYGIGGVFLVILIIVFTRHFYEVVKSAGSVEKR